MGNTLNRRYDAALRAEPRLDPALAVELTIRERDALMTAADWAYMLDKFFAQELAEGKQ